MTPVTPDSRIRDVHATAVGRDALDKVLAAAGLSPRWITNPFISRLKLRHLEPVTRRLLGPGFIDALVSVVNTTCDLPSEDAPDPGIRWWQQAVFYQIYPRSFADSNGDGIGDLRGIIDHLDHLDALGVDCLWLSPVFDSPNHDNGYDIRDYRAVMAEMGTLDDLDELIAACHDRGMRIIFDLVVNHTSDEHPWFLAARQNPDGPHGDYYFLRKGSPDTPPNNWVSFFSGSAWRWLDDAQRWSLHLFTPEQPDLNWDNPAVRREVADIVQWWLARGVDGFRLDVINYISKQPGLPDGHQGIGHLMGYPGIEQYFHGPHLHDYLAELRRDGFTRPGSPAGGPGADPVALMVGETPGIGLELGRLLAGADRHELDMVFDFDVLESPGKERWDDYRLDLNDLKRYFINRQGRLTANDWMAVFWENHDNPRMISKINPDPTHRTALGKALATILLTMRGTPFIFQGQELGAINQQFSSIGDLRDVESLNRFAERRDWPEILAGTRDHARTPMRWDPSPGHGFTTGIPWIGFHEDSTGHTVDEQAADPDSILAWYRHLITLRRQYPALTIGSIEFVDSQRRDWFSWIREHDGDRWLVQVNLSDRPQRGLGPYGSIVAQIAD